MKDVTQTEFPLGSVAKPENPPTEPTTEGPNVVPNSNPASPPSSDNRLLLGLPCDGINQIENPGAKTLSHCR